MRDTMVQPCQHCQTLWLFDEKDIGHTVACPKCQGAVTVAWQSLEESARILAEHDQRRQNARAQLPTALAEQPTN